MVTLAAASAIAALAAFALAALPARALGSVLNESDAGAAFDLARDRAQPPLSPERRGSHSLAARQQRYAAADCDRREAWILERSGRVD